MISLALPFPPSLNHYWRATTRGVLISKRGRQYRQAVIGEILTQRPASAPLTTRLSVSVELCAPDKRRRDIDNYVKAALDALVHGGVIEDDSQIDQLLIRRGDIKTPGRLYIALEEL